MQTTHSLNVWREQIGRHLMHLDFEPSHDDPFKANIEPLLTSHRLRLTRCSLSRGRISRNAELAKQGEPSHSFVIAHRRLLITHRGREIDLRPGEATILKDFEAGSVGGADGVGFSSLTVANDGSDYAQTFDMATAGARVPRSCRALRLLSAYIGSLSRSGSPGGDRPALEREIERHVLELTRLALEPSVADSSGTITNTVRGMRLADILEQIELRCTEADLDPDSVARDLGISRRYLFALLKASGISFSRRLLETRLAGAHALLTSPRERHRLITDIALSSGFSDVSYFNRSFRERYGVSPGNARQAALSRHAGHKAMTDRGA